jgi:hypothetical protein
MGEDPSEPAATEPPEDGLHLRISRRALRRNGLAALAVVVAATGVGVGLVIAGRGDSEAAGSRSRKQASTTSSGVVTTTVPAATGDPTAANVSGSSGGTEGTDEGAASADAAEAAPAEPAAEPPPAEPAPVLPTVQLSLNAIPLGCAGVGPTLKVTWSTTNAAVVALSVDGGGAAPTLSLNGSQLLDVDCGRPIAVRVAAYSVTDHSAQAQNSITINP